MILYDKLITKYIISSKIRRNLDDIDYMRRALKDNGFTDNEIGDAVVGGMKEKQTKIFKLKKKLLKIKKR